MTLNVHEFPPATPSATQLLLEESILKFVVSLRVVWQPVAINEAELFTVTSWLGLAPRERVPKLEVEGLRVKLGHVTPVSVIVEEGETTVPQLIDTLALTLTLLTGFP